MMRHKKDSNNTGQRSTRNTKRLTSLNSRRDNGCVNLPFRGVVRTLDGEIIAHTCKRQRTSVSLKRQLYKPGSHRRDNARERQAEILKLAYTGEVKASELACIFNVSDRLVRLDLTVLVKQGKLVKHGSTKSAVYCLN